MTRRFDGRRLALAFLAFSIATSCVYIGDQHTLGIDFIETVWAPARALLHGVNGFDPGTWTPRYAPLAE